MLCLCHQCLHNTALACRAGEITALCIADTAVAGRLNAGYRLLSGLFDLFIRCAVDLCNIPGISIDPLALVLVNVQSDPAKCIDHIGQSTEIDRDKILHIQIKILVDRVDGKIRSTVGISVIDLRIPVTVNTCVGVTEDRGQLDIVCLVIDADKNDRIAACIFLKGIGAGIHTEYYNIREILHVGIGKSLIQRDLLQRMILDLVNLIHKRQNQKYSCHNKQQEDQNENTDMLFSLLFTSDALVVCGAASITIHNNSAFLSQPTNIVTVGLTCIFVDVPTEKCQEQNFEIKPESPVFYIIKVAFDSFGNGGVSAVAVDLSPSGHARTNLVLDHIAWNYFLEFLDEERTLRTRTDQTHITTQDIDKLWKLINIGLTHKLSDRSYTGIILDRPCLFLLGGILYLHGTELVHLECLVVKTDSLLFENQWTR